LWADFRKAGKGLATDAVLTLPDGPLTGFGGNGLFDLERLPTRPGHRIVPLAVHGPLVEFDRKVYTATILAGKLHLGSAIEVRERVWYQAGTRKPMGSKGVLVEEWLIEFREDPRTADLGKARLRGHWRPLTKLEGESFDAEVTFQAGKSYTGGRTVTLKWPHGMRQSRHLPRLEIEDSWGGSNYMQIDDMHRLSLYPAPKPRPVLIPETVELVQPPVKKSGR
jgi:hypothetical protein